MVKPKDGRGPGDAKDASVKTVRHPASTHTTTGRPGKGPAIKPAGKS